MKTLTLVMPHEEHKPDGTMVRHQAGSTVDLPDDVANYICTAVVTTRVELRSAAAALPGTPESKK